MASVKNGSLKHRICKTLLLQKKQKKNAGFLSLEQLYSKFNAKTKVAKAHIRGIINLDRKKYGYASMFMRHKEHRGSYKIAVNKINVAA